MMRKFPIYSSRNTVYIKGYSKIFQGIYKKDLLPMVIIILSISMIGVLRCGRLLELKIEQAKKDRIYLRHRLYKIYVADKDFHDE
ncbi:MAG: hypothetical protein ISS47_02855 [Candidatus Omnitrophica bacterium]|nr:hypothetical protein [Candidatus Omnitrophota bacterium]